MNAYQWIFIVVTLSGFNLAVYANSRRKFRFFDDTDPGWIFCTAFIVAMDVAFCIVLSGKFFDYLGTL